MTGAGAVAALAAAGGFGIAGGGRYAQAALGVRRTLTLAGLCAAALVANFLLLATTALTASAGALLALLGTTAAVVAVAVVLRLSRRVTA